MRRSCRSGLVSSPRNRALVADGEYDFPPPYERLLTKADLDAFEENVKFVRASVKSRTPSQQRRRLRDLLIVFALTRSGFTEAEVASVFKLAKSRVHEVRRNFAARPEN